MSNYPHSQTAQKVIAWSVTATVSVLALYVWGHSFSWNIHLISSYQLFPVLGLLAFSIMWSHYCTGFLKRTLKWEADLSLYFRFTGYAVLAAIILHPGILIYQRFKDGYGLPPTSYENYFGPSLKWVIILGSICWLAFIAFEFHRWFGEKSWWKYIVYAGDAAMLGIFYHGLRLGDQLHTGWYRPVWYFYGASLVIFIFSKYFYQYQESRLAGRTSVDVPAMPR